MPVAPYGSWRSSLSPEDAAQGTIRFSQTALSFGDDGSVIAWWAELRPDQGGRVAVVSCQDSGSPASIGPSDLSARSLVNEYGGGAWWVDGERLFWVDATDQRLRRVDADGTVSVLTPEPPSERGWRYAAGVVTPDRRWIVCEMESHVSDDGAPLGVVVNELVAVSTEGGTPVPLVGPGDPGGGDFTAGPRISPDGSRLAWLRWDQPAMPWDAAEVWVADLVLGQDHASVRNASRWSGGSDGGAAHGLDRAVSACLPEFDPQGRLWWCDDAEDWWHLRNGGVDDITAVVDAPEEVGEPRWVSGGRRYGFSGDGRVVHVASRDGLDSVWVVGADTSHRERLPGPAFTWIEHLEVLGTVVLVVGGLPDRTTSVWRIDLADGTARDLRADDASPPDPADVSEPVSMTFPTERDEVVRCLFYPPTLAGWSGPTGSAPPLVVRSHGGPTSSARAEYSTSVQFWTTRGFAVADVNYRGSAGFGRRYRDLLNGQWGVADVRDCIAVVVGLAEAGLVDRERCVIRGGSAGGLTTLNALSAMGGEDPVFSAGCSLYGVTDLALLADDTHKFEARYLDALVGPLPEAADVYRARSPLFNADRIVRPVLLLQGAEDRVVPPSQAEVLVEALGANRVPHAYLLFEGEGHGFRRADTLVRALEAELGFYGQVLGFTPADDLDPVPVRR